MNFLLHNYKRISGIAFIIVLLLYLSMLFFRNTLIGELFSVIGLYITISAGILFVVSLAIKKPNKSFVIINCITMGAFIIIAFALLFEIITITPGTQPH